MGQESSHHARSVPIEALSHELAQRFASKCFTPLELYSFRDVFRSLADTEDSLAYWKESTLLRYLEIPDLLDVGPVLFQSVTYLGAFPFPSLAPCVATEEALLKVVVIMTERYGRVIKSGRADKVRLLFRSLAVYDRGVGRNLEDEKIGRAEKEEAQKQTAGFKVDEPAGDNDDEPDDEEDDQLALAALEALDAHDAFHYGNKSDIHHSQIPTDNFRRLIMLLIILAPLDATGSLSKHAARFTDEAALEGVRRTADNILWTFGIEQHPGIFYHTFDKVIHNSLPFLFDGLKPLFEHFLFSKNINLSQKRDSVGSVPAPAAESAAASISLEPLLPQEGEILDLALLSQLSFFLKPSNLFYRLRPLYFGSEAGFSLGSFESKVLKWSAPTILLVSGTVLSAHPESSRAREFVDSFHSSKYSKGEVGNGRTGRVVFGVYLNSPWKSSSGSCFGDAESLLFQLEPLHEVFRASTINSDYAHFSRSSKSGIAFGSAPPKTSHSSYASGSGSGAGLAGLLPGPVSLILDSSLEFGIFTHTTDGGGSFLPSKTRRVDWQTKFEIESLEVWGCGGDEEAERQRKAWAWEEREALMRRHVNLGKDIEADRALLEMAGLVGGNGGRTGGSMG